jgi:hypothetical protein
MPELVAEPVRIATVLGAKDGLLVYCESVLVAVLTHLSSPAHGENQGKWFLESGYGPCSAAGQHLFESAHEALAWAGERASRDPVHEKLASDG